VRSVSGIDYISIRACLGGDCKVNFSADTRSGGVPLSTVFTATDKNHDANSWLWNFGDGSFGQGNNVSHEYIEAGSFKVKAMSWESKGAELITISGIRNEARRGVDLDKATAYSKFQADPWTPASISFDATYSHGIGVGSPPAFSFFAIKTYFTVELSATKPKSVNVIRGRNRIVLWPATARPSFRVDGVEIGRPQDVPTGAVLDLTPYGQTDIEIEIVDSGDYAFTSDLGSWKLDAGNLRGQSFFYDCLAATAKKDYVIVT
jgi:hypothetical protein